MHWKFISYRSLTELLKAKDRASNSANWQTSFVHVIIFVHGIVLSNITCQQCNISQIVTFVSLFICSFAHSVCSSGFDAPTELFICMDAFAPTATGKFARMSYRVDGNLALRRCCLQGALQKVNLGCINLLIHIWSLTHCFIAVFLAACILIMYFCVYAYVCISYCYYITLHYRFLTWQ